MSYCDLKLTNSWMPLLSSLAIVSCMFPTVRVGAQSTRDRIEFNRDIRPIFSDACVRCHGPDEKNREGDLRLDIRLGAFVDLGDYRAIVPGNPGESELYNRIVAQDEDARMPPADAGRRLSRREVELIRRWIEQGAKWQDHWSLVRPRRPVLPEVSDSTWPRNSIDFFVLARLQRERLASTPPADKRNLLRRVTLDLTGLPPTPAEVDSFLVDETADAYEKVVDRLLASPRFGERMATPWLDAARYADTSGYQNDGPRHMWRWRDWVIDALNENMPFDQFTVEQLAGDMLTRPSLDQQIASGFNRNHRGNAEGGIIPEEYAVEYVVDRVDTTSTVWLGLTVGCARCHDHKFDPISQKEFYQIYAYFNNVPEYGRAIKEGNSPPLIKAPTPQQQRKLEQLQRDVAAAQDEMDRLAPQLSSAQNSWETKAATTTCPDPWAPADGLAAHYELNGETVDAASGSTRAEFYDGEPTYVVGPLGKAGDFDGRRFVNAGDVAHFGYFDKFSCGAWIHPNGQRGGTIVSRMTDVPQGDGYSIRLVDGRVQVNLVKRWLDDAIRVQTRRTLRPNQWHHVMVTYDGSRVASGIKVYVNGRHQVLHVHLDALNQSFASPEPLRIAGGGGADGRFHGYIDDVRVYRRRLSSEEVAIVATPDSLAKIASTPAAARTVGQAAKLRAYFLDHVAPASIQNAHRQLVALQRRKEQFTESLPTVMVMREMETPRETFVLLRGEYDKPGEKVAPAVPACLPPLPSEATNNRLAFARWLVAPDHPLTSRVTVNRYWQMLFGTGLVKTAEDFGTQGERPSHPELLDWLATEFLHNGWNVKAMLKTMVTSATYRQSSAVSADPIRRDPENRLLARGPRARLSAEMIRDQALAVSGLLVERIGGPSRKPYQPVGLWKEIATDTHYEQSKGEDLYRRSLYTYWKRTVASPTMTTFDASARETCIVRKTQTNTPLQALALMNDVTFVESSRVLAQRIMSDSNTTPEQRITRAFRLVSARRPTQAELDILLLGFQRHLADYRAAPEAAAQLVRAGEFPIDDRLDVVQLAAYTVVANLILNLDEVITKE